MSPPSYRPRDWWKSLSPEERKARAEETRKKFAAAGYRDMTGLFSKYGLMAVWCKVCFSQEDQAVWSWYDAKKKSWTDVCDKCWHTIPEGVRVKRLHADPPGLRKVDDGQ